MPVVEVTARNASGANAWTSARVARGVVPGLEARGVEEFGGMPGDFFSRAVHRAGKDGDFHQSDPEAD
ncbi:hypothetical protein P308_04715 [Pseudomonas piscis]|nr:hypothetical protein P308_04715 [Pseudomonas piscis]